MTIHVDKVTKQYGTQLALDNVSIDINKNEITGFLGPNGAGKSTLMKIITGVIDADKGSVKVAGITVTPEDINFRKRIGYLPEQNPLYPEMFVKEYLHMSAKFYQLKNTKQRIREVIEMTGLSLEAHKKIGALSKGYKQRVGIAQALIHDPEVLILDEPTSGLDPNQLEEIRNLISQISKNKTVMLSTHIMQEVEALCDRVIIINKGTIIADDTTSRINQLSKNIGQLVNVEFLQAVEFDKISKLTFVKDIEQVSSTMFRIRSSVKSDIRPEIFQLAVTNNWIIISMLEEKQSLEKVFQELTQNGRL